jgi:1,4-dihydroxy-2-naphthoate octaprenyltransferase
MIRKSTWQHLRVPFSLFLLPVFMFALSQTDRYVIKDILIVFLSLHVFIYPASNGFNSYYDKDEKSIGGLKYPPKVTKELLYISLLFDLLGILIGFLVSIEFAIAVFLYGLVSKAYSHPRIRLKKYPVFGLLTVGIFQGMFVYLACIQVFENISIKELLKPEFLFPAIITTVLLTGSYPMTQIYQHEEDKERGDNTLSLMLGIRGTFIFTGIVFFLADILFGIYFIGNEQLSHFLILQIFLIPVLIYFNWWALKSWSHPGEVNFDRTMQLNKLSSLAMILFFTLLTVLKLF